MFNKVIEAIHMGRSPLLFTAIDGERIGNVAIHDENACFGDVSLISDFFADAALPMIHNGVLVERITTPPHLILCGGGHVSVYTAKIAKMVGFRVTVIDEREEFANKERFPDVDEIVNLPFSDAIDRIQDANTYYVIVTRGHRDDRLCLETILKKPYAYCGMIGSHTKTRLVFEKMLEEGYTRAQLDAVHTPIGLPIGANTPEEIAVCIIGELIQVKNKEARGSEWDAALCNAITALNEPYAMVTLVEKHGSAPRSTGARMIVRKDGTIISSIGGGFGEYEAQQFALQMLQNGPKVKRYTCRMNNTDAASAGLICGGTIEILIQIVEA